MHPYIIIPTYGNVKRVAACLGSLLKHEPNTERYEVCVVNDGNKEMSNDLASLCSTYGVMYVENQRNSGYAVSVNHALEFFDTRHTHALLCNDDIIFIRPIIAPLKAAFDSGPHVGIVGALLLYPKGTVQHAGMAYDLKYNLFIHVYKNNRPIHPAIQKPRYCTAVTGALFAISWDAIATIGKLDEQFFVACEDTDYCLRAWNAGYSVLYWPYLKATHAEGATRGATPRQKDRHKAWKQKEQESIEYFQRKHGIGFIESINRRVAVEGFVELGMDKIKEHKGSITAKGMPIKLEIGSGYNPHPGYRHLDVRRNLPDIDYVCNIEKDRLPLRDGSVAEILANHVIEHISWRRLPHVLSEWYRVLVPGGKILLRTPNLEFIAQTYLDNRVTKEHPGDEAFIETHLSTKVTPAWWANIKLFSGQDYAANFHRVCFDFPMLSDLLKRYGFRDVKRVKFEVEYSPGELQVEAIK